MEQDLIHQAAQQQNDPKREPQPAIKLKRRYTANELLKKRLLQDDFEEPVSPGMRLRSRKHRPMTSHEKINIVYKALVQMEMQSSIAKEHRVSQGVVSRLVCKAKRNRDFYSELLAMQD